MKMFNQNEKSKIKREYKVGINAYNVNKSWHILVMG
jgi:hypothetical protein